MRSKCPAFHFSSYLPIIIILDEENRSWSSSLCSFPHRPITSSVTGPNILSINFLNALSLCSCVNVIHQVYTHAEPQATYMETTIYSWLTDETNIDLWLPSPNIWRAPHFQTFCMLCVINFPDIVVILQQPPYLNQLELYAFPYDIHILNSSRFI
jgi:hypothetical protein